MGDSGNQDEASALQPATHSTVDIILIRHAESESNVNQASFQRCSTCSGEARTSSSAVSAADILNGRAYQDGDALRAFTWFKPGDDSALSATGHVQLRQHSDGHAGITHTDLLLRAMHEWIEGPGKQQVCATTTSHCC